MFATNDTVSNILDTARIDAKGIYLKQFHALRTYEAFQYLNKMTDLQTIRLQYDEIEKQLQVARTAAQIVRIIFSERDFSYEYQVHDIKPLQCEVFLQLVTELRQKPGLGAQNYKWEKRSYWEKLLSFKTTSAFDVISINEKNEVTETSRFNLFFYDEKNNVVKTPGLNCGCINGVYRRYIFQQGMIHLPGIGLKKIIEETIHVADINLYQLFVANSVRGVLPAAVME